MDAFTFLQDPDTAPSRPVYVLHGDEDFLKRQVLAALRRRILGATDDSFAYSAYPGDKADLAIVLDELRTLPFLSGIRLVVVDQADPFVTRFRAQLEKYVAGPSDNGVLVLDVKAWTATTRLAKLLDKDATLTCKAPPEAKLADWCIDWAKTRYGKTLPQAAARHLVDLVGSEMGLLDQELAKLAVYAGEAVKIEAQSVDLLVGSNREENIWKLFDLIAAGQPSPALEFLGRLFEQGEDPHRLLGAFSLQMRRLAQVARLVRPGLTLNMAMEQAGVPPFSQRNFEGQLRHLGRRRLDRLYDWLLEMDLGLKGSSGLPPRTLFEHLVVRLARKNA